MDLIKASAIAVDPVNVYIICPFCGKVHTHGSNGDPSLDSYGNRSPHCVSEDCSKHGQYNIICSSSTVRCQKPLFSAKKALQLHRRQSR